MASPLRRNEPINTWQAGDTVVGFALLAKKELREDRNNKSFLDLELVDATGSISAKVWSDSPAMAGDFECHGFIAFKGTVKSYREQLQVSILECRRATEADRAHGFDETRLVPSTREDIGELWERLTTLLAAHVRRPPLARLVEGTLAAYGPALREHPAAKTIHHAYRGGLLEHVVSMAELAVRVADHYPDIDRELVLLGVLYHDLGKLRELGAMPANDYTLEGRLVGHVVMGRDLLRERCAAIADFPAELRLLLEHLVLSHQGLREYGSPVEPMTAEAFVLHFIDDLDSKLNQLRRAREAGREVQYLRSLGRHVYLASPGPEHAPAPHPPAEEDPELDDGQPAAPLQSELEL